MSATFLSLMQDVCNEIGLPQPGSVMGNADQTVTTLIAMANREGRDLVREHDWTVLTRLATITTTATIAEYALPSDYARLCRDTEWDVSNLMPLIGPIDGVYWRTIKSGGIGSGIVGNRFRIFRASTGVGRTVYIDPTPAVSNAVFNYEYISNQWCASAGGALQSAWTADTDVFLIDDDLMRLGTIVRYRRTKGLDYTSEAQEYSDMLTALKGQDRPAPTLSLTPNLRPRLLDYNNLPETGMGS